MLYIGAFTHGAYGVTVNTGACGALDQGSIEAFGRKPGFTGEGGSIPFLGELAKRYPEVQFVATGVLGPQSNAHAIDEMLDLPTAVGVTNAVVTILTAHAQSKES